MQPWIWKSVPQGAYIHGNASCCDASCSQWGKEFPGDSPFVLQETVDLFGLNMLSQERHAPDSSSYIVFTD